MCYLSHHFNHSRLAAWMKRQHKNLSETYFVRTLKWSKHLQIHNFLISIFCAFFNDPQILIQVANLHPAVLIWMEHCRVVLWSITGCNIMYVVITDKHFCSTVVIQIVFFFKIRELISPPPSKTTKAIIPPDYYFSLCWYLGPLNWSLNDPLLCPPSFSQSK